MRVPINWLSQYVSLPQDKAELAERLTMAGHMLDKKEGQGADLVFDLELRQNRGDLYGILGMAREVAALYGKTLKPLTVVNLKDNKITDRLIKVEAGDLVNRFLAVTIGKASGLKTEERIKRWLGLYGLPSIEPIVDLTNFVMVETGQPMHAFDADKVTGGRLILRRAEREEKFISLHKIEYSLTKEDLVVADKEGPLALAGLIGGRRAAISDSSKKIIVESGNYNPVSVRRTSLRHKIRTEASTRLEKKLDPAWVKTAIERFLKLADQGCQIWQDYYPDPPKEQVIQFQPGEVERLAGVKIKKSQIRRILESLGFVVSDNWRVRTPGFRADVEEAADLVEEAARIWGYEKIQPEPLLGEIPKPIKSPLLELETKIKTLLVGLGLNEAVSMPLVEEKRLLKWENNPKRLVLQNPVVEELTAMRTNLGLGLIDYLKRARQNRSAGLGFFEIGKVYFKKTNGYTEKTIAAGVIAGEKLAAGWNWKKEVWDFYKAKGVVEAILLGLRIKADFTRLGQKSVNYLNPKEAAEITVGKVILGRFGALKPSIIAWGNLKGPVFLFELDLEKLLKIKPAESVYLNQFPFPPIIEDLSLIVKGKIDVQVIIQAIYSASISITKVELWDVHGHSRTFRIWYQDRKKTLSSKEVETVRNKIRQKLASYPVVIRE